MSLALCMDQKQVLSAYYSVQFIMHSSFIDFLCNDFLVNSKTVTLVKALGVGCLPLSSFGNTLLFRHFLVVCVCVWGETHRKLGGRFPMEKKPYTPGGGREQLQLCHTRDSTAGGQGSRRKSRLRTHSCVHRVTFSSRRAIQVSVTLSPTPAVA